MDADLLSQLDGQLTNSLINESDRKPKVIVSLSSSMKLEENLKNKITFKTVL